MDAIVKLGVKQLLNQNSVFLSGAQRSRRTCGCFSVVLSFCNHARTLMRSEIYCVALALLVTGGAACAAEPFSTLASVRAAGVLRCGIDSEEAEYSNSDDHGNSEAFDADLCRAVAVAVLGKDAQVKATRYPDDQSAMHGLTSGEVDLVATLPDDFSHAVGTHLEFTRPVLWDGVGFLMPEEARFCARGS